MPHEIIIWDSQLSPKSKSKDTVVLWRSYGESDFPAAVSIPLFIEENSDVLRSRYLDWIYSLGECKINDRSIVEHFEIRDNFSYWWMTLLVEKCNFAKSPQITDVIRLFALDVWISQNDISKIKLVSSNRNLAECLEIWANARGIAITWQGGADLANPLSLVKRIYHLLPSTLQGLMWLIKYLIEHWSLRGVGVNEWRMSNGVITFISYSDNMDIEKTSRGAFGSRYWTTLPEMLADKGVKTNWLHIYIKDGSLPTSKQAANLIRGFNENDVGLQAHVTLSSFLSLSVVVRTLSDWFILQKRCIGLESKLSNLPMVRYLWPFFSKDWRNSITGRTAVSNLLMHNLFEAALEQLPTQKKGVYLQENQGWEFGLIQAWKSNMHKGLIGFPHSTVRFWDLRYFFHPKSYVKTDSCQIPLPNRIACNGAIALEAYKNGMYPSNELIEVESLRYLYLTDFIAGNKLLVQKSGKRLLVVGDYLAINTHKQLCLLESAIPLLHEGTTVTIKPHPNCPIDPSQYPCLKMNIETKPLGELMEHYDIVYASSTTSAAVDAFCAGLPVIVLLDGSDLNMSPLRGCNGVVFISNPEELAKLVNDDIDDAEEMQRKEYFFLDLELPRWRQLLEVSSAV